MPKKIVGQFSVEYIQALDENGVFDPAIFPALSDKEVSEIYEKMVLARVFDEKALNLQRQGRLGTYASIRGQEALQVGAGSALQASDWWFPAFREVGISLVRGLPLETIFLYWSGDERGNAIPPGQNDFPIAIPVGTHIPHAVGAAWGAKIKGDPVAVLTTFGDGATSKGDFHESLNLAAVFSLPVVFLCQNNQWAISLPRSSQTASKTIAQKGISYGIPGVQIDGNDIFVVYGTVREALERARRGGGPTLIEAVTYRMGDHTTADDASRYRALEEVKAWEKKDPILRLKRYMEKEGRWTSAYEAEVAASAAKKIEETVKAYEGTPPPDPSEIFRHVFEKLTPDLAAQQKKMDSVRSRQVRPSGEGHEKGHNKGLGKGHEKI